MKETINQQRFHSLVFYFSSFFAGGLSAAVVFPYPLLGLGLFAASAICLCLFVILSLP